MKLDRKSVKILRCFYKQGSLDSVGLSIFLPFEMNDICECISFLLQNELIQVDNLNGCSSSPENGFFRISKPGEAFLQHHFKKTVFSLTPIIASIVAAIAGIISAVSSL